MFRSFSLVRSTVVSASVFALFAVLTFGDVRVASAAVRLPRVLGSGMVLQRDAKVPVWGWGDVGEKVTVTLMRIQRGNPSVDTITVEITLMESDGSV